MNTKNIADEKAKAHYSMYLALVDLENKHAINGSAAFVNAISKEIDRHKKHIQAYEQRYGQEALYFRMTA